MSSRKNLASIGLKLYPPERWRTVRCGEQGPTARNVIAQAVGLGCQTTKKNFQGLKGRPNIHAAEGPALQAGGRWGGTGSLPRAFSPGYHIAGFQPSSNGNEIIGKSGGADRLRNAVNPTQEPMTCHAPSQWPTIRNASAQGPKARHTSALGPTARNVIARPVGPGWQTTKIFRGLKGRSNIHAAEGPALQAGGRWGGTDSLTRAFSPGYHRTGLQPASNAVNQIQSLLYAA
jgi:hypothetical protein